MKRLAALSALLALNAFAGEEKPTGTLIDFQAQAQRSAPNDLGSASVYYEATGAQPGELARKVNQVVASALTTAKAQSEVRFKSGGSQTYPIYAKNSRTIDSWRMRSELLLESRDSAALSELLGKLQTTLTVGNINFAPAPETRRKIEDEAALDAITAFQDKATRYAAALKKNFRIRSMNINSHGVSPVPTFRAMAMMADAAPMPVEAGDSQVMVTVNGQIELLDTALTTTIQQGH